MWGQKHAPKVFTPQPHIRNTKFLGTQIAQTSKTSSNGPSFTASEGSYAGPPQTNPKSNKTNCIAQTPRETSKPFQGKVFQLVWKIPPPTLELDILQPSNSIKHIPNVFPSSVAPCKLYPFSCSAKMQRKSDQEALQGLESLPPTLTAQRRFAAKSRRSHRLLYRLYRCFSAHSFTKTYV